jgi:carboxylesterase
MSASDSVRDRSPERIAATVRVDASPFDLRPEPERATGAAALCLHGLTGTPWEVRSIAEALVARGIRAYGPHVAGHEGGIHQLARTTRQTWLEQAGADLAALQREHDRVFLVGVSLGGLLSLRLAQTRDVAGLVVVGVPLVLRAPIPQLLPWVSRWMPFRRKRGSDIRDPAAGARHPNLPAMPLAAVVELIALQGEVIPHLGRIRAPALVAHGRFDRTAHPRDAVRLHGALASNPKELFMLERSGHVATVDYDGPALARAAGDFLGGRGADPQDRVWTETRD